MRSSYRSLRAILFGAVAWASCLACASSAIAQQAPRDAQAAGDDRAPQLKPPELKHFEPARYPVGAEEVGLEGVVVLELTVTPEGEVQDLQVVESAGPAFDAAALRAAPKLRFEPAKRDGEPIPARIRYRYVFEVREKPSEPEAPAEQAEPAPPSGPGRLEGRVLGAEEGEPLENARVVLSAEQEDLSRSQQTGPDGRFRFEELPPGRYSLFVDAEGRRSLQQAETVAANQVTEVTYRVREEVDPYAFEATAQVDPPPREVTRRTIEREALTRVAGTRGDALRTVQLLPGVARPPGLAGVLIVRGSSPNDSQVLFEDLPVPLLYHFGGLTSVLQSRLLERIEFYPGNFSVRYGRQRGGIVDVEARKPATDGFHGVADISLIDMSVLAEGPITDDASVAVAARRSNIDFVFETIVPDDAFDVLAAPVYYDYQALASIEPSSRDEVELQVFGSSDRLELLISDPPDQDPDLRGNFNFSTQFHRVQGTWDRRLSRNVTQEVRLSSGYTDVVANFGQAVRFNLDFVPLYARAEWQARVNDRVRLIGGLDIQGFDGEFGFSGPPPDQGEGSPPDPLATQDEVSTQGDFQLIRPAVYLESSLRLTDALRVVLGSRLDWYSEIDEWSYDPRISGHYALTDQTTLKAGVGMFSQPPQFQESSEELGNPDLEPTRTVHVSGGVDHDFTDKISLGLEGFYKHLTRRVVSLEGPQRPPYFTNDGIGRIYGVELLGKVEPTDRFFGFLSYTLSRSLRKDHDGPWRPFDFDQPHILTVSGTYVLGAGWEMGATFRLVSGNPETPIVGSVYDARADAYQPLFGEINSQRLPSFNRLDVRVEKQWTFEHWKLALYLDIQNVYNQRNPEGRLYSFDYSEQSIVSGVPIFPSLGIRGEM